MIEHRELALLDQILEAARLGCRYVEGYEKADFIADKRTQQAVVLNIRVIGEIAVVLSRKHAEFVKEFANLPWHDMRNMRNRIAHGHHKLNLEAVGGTAHDSLPELARLLPSIIDAIERKASASGSGDLKSSI